MSTTGLFDLNSKFFMVEQWLRNKIYLGKEKAYGQRASS